MLWHSCCGYSLPSYNQGNDAQMALEFISPCAQAELFRSSCGVFFERMPTGERGHISSENFTGSKQATLPGCQTWHLGRKLIASTARHSQKLFPPKIYWWMMLLQSKHPESGTIVSRISLKQFIMKMAGRRQNMNQDKKTANQTKKCKGKSRNSPKQRTDAATRGNTAN